MPTFRETTYAELAHEGHPQEIIGQQVSEATRVYLVPWDARQQAALDFLGYVEPEPIGTPPFPSRVTPDYHPGYLNPDGQPYLWADSVTFEPYGQPVDGNGNPIYGGDANIDASNEPLYNKAKMTVHYSTRLFQILNDDEFVGQAGSLGEASLFRHIEMPFATSAQYLTLPDGTFKVAVDGFGDSFDINGIATHVPAAPVPGAPGKIDGQWDVTMIWRQVPRSMIAAAAVQYPISGNDVKQASFDYAIGHVNAVAFAGYPPGTLLCEPMELTQWLQANGEIVFDVTFHFKYYPRGWNYFLMKNSPSSASNLPPAFVYTQISTDGVYRDETLAVPPEGVMLYDAFDFHNLFYGYAYTKGGNPSP